VNPSSTPLGLNVIFIKESKRQHEKGKFLASTHAFETISFS